MRIVAAVGPFKFCSIQLVLPPNLTRKFLSLTKQVAPEDIDENDGLETKPHITVKYGLHPEATGNVASVLTDLKAVPVRFTAPMIFESPEQDVLVVNVVSPYLHMLNDLITRKLQCTTTFPSYTPHATIGYLKKGTGAKYKDLDLGIDPNRWFLLSDMECCNLDGEPTKLQVSKTDYIRPL